MQCRFPEVFEYRKVWRDLSGSTQIVVDDQMQVIRIRDASQSYSLNSDESGSQEVKLVMRCRTSHGTGGIQKYVVHTTTSEWYCNEKLTLFCLYYVRIKKNLWSQIKNAHWKAEKKHTNQASTFLNIRKKGMIRNLGLFFGRFSIFIQYAILKYITCFEYYIFLKRKMQVITVIYESSVPINFEFWHVYDSIIMALTFGAMF